MGIPARTALGWKITGRLSSAATAFKLLRDEAGRKFRALELQLDSLPDTDIQGLRETRRQYKDQRDRHLRKQSEIETQLAGLRHEGEKLEARTRPTVAEAEERERRFLRKKMSHMM